MIQKKSLYNTMDFGYNAQNRVVKASVTVSGGDTAEEQYEYDAFGRRSVVKSRTASAYRTLYDGFSFDVIREEETLSSGAFARNFSGALWEGGGYLPPERYRYLGESAPGRVRTPESAGAESGRPGERTMLYAKGKPVASNAVVIHENGSAYGVRAYFGSDTIGSVKTVTLDTGDVSALYEYDAFGAPVKFDAGVKGEGGPGYAGKPWDSATGLYNYGFRDYQPSLARFTTVDPVRAGFNWFAYTNNDPVNWVDLWGLDTLSVAPAYTMNDPASAWTNVNIYGYGKTIGDEGCAITAAANVVKTFDPSSEVTPSDINVEGIIIANGNISWDALGAQYGYAVSKTAGPLTQEAYTALTNDDTTVNAIVVEVAFNAAGASHFVGVKDIETINGKDYVVISPTSQNDNSVGSGSNRSTQGWTTNSKGETVAPTAAVKSYVVFTQVNPTAKSNTTGDCL
jgi:RHS repeat-associated protein